MTDRAAPITSYRQGQDVCIEWLGVDDDQAARLRELGLREGCRVCVMMNSDKCVLGFGSCRVALQREIAMCLFGSPAQ